MAELLEASVVQSMCATRLGLEDRRSVILVERIDVICAGMVGLKSVVIPALNSG